MFNKIKSMLYQLAGIDHFDNDFSDLNNVRPLSSAERRAALIMKEFPHLKEAEIIKDAEEGWIRVVR